MRLGRMISYTVRTINSFFKACAQLYDLATLEVALAKGYAAPS